MHISRQTLVEEIHKPARRNYPRRRVEVRAIDETWQADLVDMQKFASVNKGYNFLLTVIDIVSKFAWTVPLKHKTMEEVTNAFKLIFKKGRVPTKIQADDGKEFFNKECKDLFKHYKIKLYSTYSNLKASIIERFNRTLKNKMWKTFTLQGNNKWLDILPILTAEYNNTKHRTIGMKPKDVNKTNERLVISRIKQQEYYKIRRNKKPKFKVGDKVHISKYKHIFEKGYTPNWTTETFTIRKVRKTKPYTYLLKDYKDEPVLGGFYEEELQKTAYPDVYLLEKVIRKKGNKLYVKWLGFDDTHNSWINKNDVT